MKKEFIIILLLALLLAACGEDKPEASSPLAEPSSSPLAEPSSPIVPAATKPAVAPAPTDMPKLTLDQPLNAGMDMVTGSGPAGLPIRLYDVGITGEELGSVVIGQQGTFSIQLLSPLRSGQRVGLALGDLQGTTFKRQDFTNQALIDLPIIGLLFADVTVQ
jgi:hypothetical protein